MLDHLLFLIISWLARPNRHDVVISVRVIIRLFGSRRVPPSREIVLRTSAVQESNYASVLTVGELIAVGRAVFLKSVSLLA